MPELLAPAGNMETLKAAIDAGCDAVYFGGGDFNARMRARNFDAEETAEAISLCREYGIRSYLTVNTRLRDAEYLPALEFARSCFLLGADAFIVADAALAEMIRKDMPTCEIHASTQLSCGSVYDAAELQGMGFSRMVCPRELSLDEIKNLVAGSPIEIEMFVHGAHCVSFSGQCMMSFAMGGRSGNRGMCAQPCRLPFSMGSVPNGYPLSLKDMCLAGSMEALIASNVASLKIEGRQKDASYVSGTVAVYRRLLDEGRNATASEIAELEKLFSRDGFTDGYLKGRYSSMLGVRGDVLRLPEKKEDPSGKIARKLSLNAELVLRIGEFATLRLSSNGRSAEVKGATVEYDIERELDAEHAEKNLSRLGNTAYRLDSFSFTADSGAFITLSEVNSLRREGVRRLMPPLPKAEDSGHLDPRKMLEPQDKQNSGTLKRRMTAEFLSYEMIPDEAFGFFDRIFVPMEDAAFADGEKICVSLPPVTVGKAADELEEKLRHLSGHVLVHGIGQARMARKCGLDPEFSIRANVLSARLLEKLSDFASPVCFSPEASIGAARDATVPFSLVVYGKIPLMHTQRCLISDGARYCQSGGFGGRHFPVSEKKHKGGRVSCDGRLCFAELRDRRDATFFTVGLPDCSNAVFNSVPIYMADRMEEIDLPMLESLHFIFSDETKDECRRVIEAYRLKKRPKDPSKVRRLK